MNGSISMHVAKLKKAKHACKEENRVRGFLTEVQQQKEEWWAVDGELSKREEFRSKLLLDPEPNEAIPTRRRRKERIRHLLQTRLKLRNDHQESYWVSYMRRFQIMRDEWEISVWDPKAAPKPRPRNPVWVKEESERYIWMDPRRDFCKTKDSDSCDDRSPRLSRMDGNRSHSPSSSDHKLVAGAQRTHHFPNDRQREAGTSNKYAVLPSPSVSRSSTHQTTSSHAYNSRISTGDGRSAVQNCYEYNKDDASDSEDWDQAEDESDVESTDTSEDEDGDIQYKYSRQKPSKANTKPKNMRHYEDDLFKDEDDDS